MSIAIKSAWRQADPLRNPPTPLEIEPPTPPAEFTPVPTEIPFGYHHHQPFPEFPTAQEQPTELQSMMHFQQEHSRVQMEQVVNYMGTAMDKMDDSIGAKVDAIGRQMLSDKKDGTAKEFAFQHKLDTLLNLNYLLIGLAVLFFLVLVAVVVLVQRQGVATMVNEFRTVSAHVVKSASAWSSPEIK